MHTSLSAKNLSVLAAVAAASIIALPMAIGTGNAMTERAEAPALRTTIASVDAASAPVEGCARKVRVVYSGYAAAPACAQAR